MRQGGELPDRCRAANVLGSRLFSFIENEGVRCVYDAMQGRIHQTGNRIAFPFRCDSPWFRREMEMSISRDGDTLRYDSVIVHETKRQRPLPQPTPAANTLISMCSFCKAYRFPADSKNWKDVDLIFMERNLPERFSVTHGMCESCATRWLRES